MEPTKALELLQALPIAATITEYVVAQELHEDGEPHLHAFLKYSAKVQFGPRRWDIADFHGNYQPAQCWRAVQRYCAKGGNYISNFDLDAAANKKAAGRDLNKRLLEEHLPDLVREGVVPLEKYLKIKACKEAFFKDSLPSLPRCTLFVPNSLGKVFPVLDQKRRHFWIWSRQPDTGKTTFLKSVACQFPSYWYSYKEGFQSAHPGTQFVLLDEYSSPHLQATQLNQMCDGTWQYPVKCGTAIQLESPIVLVASNKPPEEVYPNVFQLINARFFVFEL